MKDTKHPLAKAPTQGTKGKYSYEERHWYMIAVEMHYVKPSTDPEAEPSLRAQKLNVMITPKKRKITAKDIGDIRQLALLCMRDHYKVDIDTMADFIILNMMYMGLMSEHAYFTEGQEASPLKQ